MPHLTIQYSANLEKKSGMRALCVSLSHVLQETGLYPLGGIRVRALKCDDFAVADEAAENAFADMVFRIGAGRTQAEKEATGKSLMAAAEQHFAKELATQHFALSLEIIEISPVLSWKTNSIHPRLAVKAKSGSKF